MKCNTNIIKLVKTDFDYAQSDRHPERSRRVFEKRFLWFYPKLNDIECYTSISSFTQSVRLELSE